MFSAPVGGSPVPRPLCPGSASLPLADPSHVLIVRPAESALRAERNVFLPACGSREKPRTEFTPRKPPPTFSRWPERGCIRSGPHAGHACFHQPPCDVRTRRALFRPGSPLKSQDFLQDSPGRRRPFPWRPAGSLAEEGFVLSLLHPGTSRPTPSPSRSSPSRAPRLGVGGCCGSHPLSGPLPALTASLPLRVTPAKFLVASFSTSTNRLISSLSVC